MTSEHLEAASLNLLHTRDLKFRLSSLDIQVRCIDSNCAAPAVC